MSKQTEQSITVAYVALFDSSILNLGAFNYHVIAK